MLPRLRQDLQLYRAPPDTSGAPTFTLLDPVSNRFFHIGWRVSEIILRWDLRDANAIAVAITRETVLSVAAVEVEQVAAFLTSNNLTADNGAELTARFLQHDISTRRSLFYWLLHNYLFIRLPLLQIGRAHV